MLKRVSEFTTEVAKRLQEQLSRFEQNVATETSSIRAAAIMLEPVSFLVNGTITSFGVGQIALCDSTLGALTITLSRPTKPGWAAIAKQVAANNVTIVPAGINAVRVAPRINQAASKAIAAVGLYWLYFDGNNWQANV